MTQNAHDERDKTLSGNAYYDDDRKTPKGVIVDHSFDQYTQNPKTGFYARVYYDKNIDTVTIAIRGTDDRHDIFSDRQMTKGKIPAQFYDADKLYYYVQKKYPHSNIEFTGHSLAASTANLMSLHTGRPSTGFEPYGTGKIIKKHPELFNKDADITNYGRKGDWIFQANSNYQPGKTYILPALERRFDLPFRFKLPFMLSPLGAVYNGWEIPRLIKSGLWESHILENYPSLDKAQLFKKNAGEGFSYEQTGSGLFKLGIEKKAYTNSISKIQTQSIFPIAPQEKEPPSFLEKLGYLDMHKQFKHLYTNPYFESNKQNKTNSNVVGSIPKTSGSVITGMAYIKPSPPPFINLNPAYQSLIEQGYSTVNADALVNNYLNGTNATLENAANAIKTPPVRYYSSSSNSGWNWFNFFVGWFPTMDPGGRYLGNTGYNYATYTYSGYIGYSGSGNSGNLGERYIPRARFFGPNGWYDGNIGLPPSFYTSTSAIINTGSGWYSY